MSVPVLQTAAWAIVGEDGVIDTKTIAPDEREAWRLDGWGYGFGGSIGRISKHAAQYGRRSIEIVITPKDTPS